MAFDNIVRQDHGFDENGNMVFAGLAGAAALASRGNGDGNPNNDSPSQQPLDVFTLNVSLNASLSQGSYYKEDITNTGWGLIAEVNKKTGGNYRNLQEMQDAVKSGELSSSVLISAAGNVASQRGGDQAVDLTASLYEKNMGLATGSLTAVGGVIYDQAGNAQGAIWMNGVVEYRTPVIAQDIYRLDALNSDAAKRYEQRWGNNDDLAGFRYTLENPLPTFKPTSLEDLEMFGKGPTILPRNDYNISWQNQGDGLNQNKLEEILNSTTFNQILNCVKNGEGIFTYGMTATITFPFANISIGGGGYIDFGEKEVSMLYNSSMEYGSSYYGISTGALNEAAYMMFQSANKTGYYGSTPTCGFGIFDYRKLAGEKMPDFCSAAIGFEFGMYKSLDDFKGAFYDSGGSMNILKTPMYCGLNAVLNTNGKIIGYTAETGYSIGPWWEAHPLRAGYTFVKEIKK